MQINFNDIIKMIIQIYLNDLIVYSKIREDHFQHLRHVFLRCQKYGISLNPTKSIFDVTSRKLLGHTLSDSGISVDIERIISLKNLLTPTSKKEIQSFMGKNNLVRRFIPDFANMVKPIHNLLNKYQVFSCNPNIEKDFVDINML